MSPGEFPHEKDGDGRRKFWREPKRGTKIPVLWGHKFLFFFFILIGNKTAFLKR